MTPTFYKPRVAITISRTVTDACFEFGPWIRRQRRRVVSFPQFSMGQYFKAVNLDKREIVCPWCLGGGAKLWEWAANSQGAIFTLLLRKSSATGGGDYFDPLSHADRQVHLDPGSEKDGAESLAKTLLRFAAVEGQPISRRADSIVGRWAGDRVVLVGDYDESQLWDELPGFQNISQQLAETWNQFIALDDRKLTFNPGCSCREEVAA